MPNPFSSFFPQQAAPTDPFKSLAAAAVSDRPYIPSGPFNPSFPGPNAGGPVRPGGGDSRTLPGPGTFFPRPPQRPQRPTETGGGGYTPGVVKPWQIWQRRLHEADWMLNGETPPPAMIKHLQVGDRPALMEAIRRDPRLMSIFSPYLGGVINEDPLPPPPGV